MLIEIGIIKQIAFEFADQCAVQNQFPMKGQEFIEIDSFIAGIFPASVFMSDQAHQHSQVQQGLIGIGLIQLVDNQTPVGVMTGRSAGGINTAKTDYDWKMGHLKTA